MNDDGITGCPDDETLHSLMAGTLSTADDTVMREQFYIPQHVVEMGIQSRRRCHGVGIA